MSDAARLEQSAASVCFWPLREDELLSWIVSSAELGGKKIGMQAANDLGKHVTGSVQLVLPRRAG